MCVLLPKMWGAATIEFKPMEALFFKTGQAATVFVLMISVGNEIKELTEKQAGAFKVSSLL